MSVMDTLFKIIIARLAVKIFHILMYSDKCTNEEEMAYRARLLTDGQKLVHDLAPWTKNS
jgi:hypothetical protein